MNVSAPVKVFALLGIVAVVLIGGYTMVLGGGSMEASSAELPLKNGVIETQALAREVASQASADAKAKAAGKAPAAKTKSTPPAAKAKPRTRRPAPVIAANGLPSRIVTALRRSEVVVVALWGSGGKIDELARDEAAAGAAAARATFIPLNVIRSGKEAEALTLKLGVLRTPTVLLFRGDSELAIRLDGFRDRETVAQAALSALSGPR